MHTDRTNCPFLFRSFCTISFFHLQLIVVADQVFSRKDLIISSKTIVSIDNVFLLGN